MDIQGKSIAVLGVGQSGLAVAKLLLRHGVRVFVSDSAPLDEKEEARELLNSLQIPYEFGEHSEKVLRHEGIVVSPGISLNHPILLSAQKACIPIWGELEVASWFCKSPIVAITGSNGKSTVTQWIGEVFQKSGLSTLVAGNIGNAFSEWVEKSVPEGVVVLEVSSFQLETIHTFHPFIAVFLNLSQDHLNRHGTLENYGKMKARIFENQTENDYAILNGEDDFVRLLTQSIYSKRVFFGHSECGEWCGFVRGGKLVLRLNGTEEELLSVSELALPGDHNLQNALAVALATRVFGINQEIISEALHTFRGLPHRLEWVRTLDQVRWVNDSKATNVDSVRYALGSFEAPIVLIAGGRDKDSDFTVLREEVKKKVRCGILIGEAAEKIEKAWERACPLIRANSLKEAVDMARKQAHSGDVVLLSPACASFDMFKNFEDRGEQFKKLVWSLS